jgi:predicted signal transduction protein with EAL and GGDEF domain
VRLALDDFGTDHSGLRHLQMLPFDKIKADASFVSNMNSCLESSKIVAAVVALGRSLGLLTVAEGIEDAATATALKDRGCHIGQGWLFVQPSAAAEAGVLACDGGAPTLRLPDRVQCISPNTPEAVMSKVVAPSTEARIPLDLPDALCTAVCTRSALALPINSLS